MDGDDREVCDKLDGLEIGVSERTKFLAFLEQKLGGDKVSVATGIGGDVAAKCIEDDLDARELILVVEEDPKQFLRDLEVINDENGQFLVNFLQKVLGKDRKLAVRDGLMEAIRRELETQTDCVVVQRYLGYYYAILTNFDGGESVANVPIFLGHLNPLYQEKDGDTAAKIYALVTLIVLEFIKTSKQDTVDQIRDYLDVVMDEKPEKFLVPTYLLMIKCMEVMFPVIPTVIGPIYVGTACKVIILHQISKLSEASLQYPTGRLVIKETLKLISSSCLDENCRVFSSTNYSSLLCLGTRLPVDGNAEIKNLSSLCVIKLWNEVQSQSLAKSKEKESLNVSLKDLLEPLSRYLVQAGDEDTTNLDVCVEGIAFLSMKASVKNELRSDESLIEKLLHIYKGYSGNQKSLYRNTVFYGILLIFCNITKLLDTSQNTDKQTVNFLKQVSNPNKADKSKEDQGAIKSFNKALLINHNVVSVISQIGVQERTSHSIMSIMSMISAVGERAVAQELVKQGAVKLVLEYLFKNSKINDNDNRISIPISDSAEIVDGRLNAIRCLARILIFVNPILVFKKYDVKTSIPFLVELLGPDISRYNFTNESSQLISTILDKVTVRDKYDALLALTNLASLKTDANSDINQIIARRTFDNYLDNFIIDVDFPLIQNAAWELISNLIYEPTMLAKFFNIEKNENRKRLDILVNLLNSENETLQVTIAGLLANATSEYELICEILLLDNNVREKLISTASDILSKQWDSEDLVLRMTYILSSLVFVSAESDKSCLTTFKNNEYLKQSLRTAVVQGKDPQALKMLEELDKVLRS